DERRHEPGAARNTLCSDGAAHKRLRRVVIRPLTPAALKSLQAEVEREAEAVVDRLCARGRLLRDRYLPIRASCEQKLSGFRDSNRAAVCQIKCCEQALAHRRENLAEVAPFPW